MRSIRRALDRRRKSKDPVDVETTDKETQATQTENLPTQETTAEMAEATTETPAATEASRCKIYVVFYSMYGHVYKLAQSIKKGIDSVDGCEGVLYQVRGRNRHRALERRIHVGCRDTARGSAGENESACQAGCTDHRCV